MKKEKRQEKRKTFTNGALTCGVCMFLFLSTIGMLSSGCLKEMFLFLLSSFFLLLLAVLNRFHDRAFMKSECFLRFFSRAFFSEIILALSLLFRLMLLFCNELLLVGG